MPHASPWSRQLAAFSLASLYSTTSLLSGATLLWLLNSGIFTPALSQQLPTVEPNVAPELTDPTTSRELIEGARDRVRTPEELPALTPDLLVEPQVPLDQFDSYRLGPGDAFFVSIPRFPDLNFQATLDLQGNVLVPLVGAVSLRGLTLEEAERRIQAELNRFVVNPDVSLSLVAQRPVQVTVVGEVFEPGYYPLAAPQISVALLSAGGTTGMADLRSVRIRRALPNGTALEETVDLFTPLKDAGSIPDLRLEDGDAVIVPRLEPSTASEYDRNLVARSTLAQQQINVRVLSYVGTTGSGRVADGGVRTLALPNGSTFLDALTAVSPNLNNANLQQVALVRFDPEQGKAVAANLNARNALRGDVSQDPPLENNDVVIIGRNLVGRVTYALNTFTQPFRDVLGFLLFFDSLRDSADNLFGPGGNNDDD